MVDRPRDSAQIIADAELARFSFDGHVVGSAYQKGVLWAIFMNEDRPISFIGFEARVCASKAACFRAVQALILQDLITERECGGCRARAYRINYDALRKLKTRAPLFGVGGGRGGPARERPVFDGQVLPVEGRSFSEVRQ